MWSEGLELAILGPPPPPPPVAEQEVVGLVPALPDELMEPGRWRCLIKGRWKRPEAIHCKEARAAFYGLEREAALPDGHDEVVLAAGDNLAEVLASERGRARCRELLGLVRRGAAVRLAANIRWCRRYIDTKRNISDYDSRHLECPRGGPALVPTPLAAAVPRSWARAASSCSRPPSTCSSWSSLFSVCSDPRSIGTGPFADGATAAS